ncbi:MAG: hypothetical protein FWG64_10025 [Firmicutes bacterium]|nr:hypothetical protein [Bacillota bacterium]
MFFETIKELDKRTTENIAETKNKIPLLLRITGFCLPVGRQVQAVLLSLLAF